LTSIRACELLQPSPARDKGFLLEKAEKVNDASIAPAQIPVCLPLFLTLVEQARLAATPILFSSLFIGWLCK
jgi:hypothetical protein